MKRYWRLITIVTVVVLTIGTFYIQSSLAASDLPGVTIETVSGDADEMDPVTIGGNYNADGQLVNVHVDKTGATYSNEQSLFQRLRGSVQERVQELREEHRGFMRGKQGNAVSYLEADNKLAYASVTNQIVSQGDKAAFDIAVLDKESGETTSFTVPVPDRATYNYLYIDDVQMSDDELVLITRNITKDGKKEERLYHADMGEQTISDGETILSQDHTNTNKRDVNFNILTSGDGTAPRKDILFRKRKQITVSEGDQDKQQAQEFETKTAGYVAYNLKTGETQELDTPEALADQAAISRDDTTLYFKNGEKVTVYNFEKGEITQKIALPESSSSSSAKDRRSGSVMRIKDNKGYILTRNEDMPQRLLVLDLASGDTLYEGRISFDDIDDNATVYLSNLTID
ncbi:hypothetical protein GCM10028778_26280 [Barrientosiimonas marina]|uniref:HlyD family secretion protein n=1 Tax=Lentibacillus kimchii TaxID=1542911 RepID=A0ABW2USK8_9BACI